MQRLTSEEAVSGPSPPHPPFVAPSAFGASPRLTRPIASPSPYSTGTRGATCSRGRRCHTRASVVPVESGESPSASSFSFATAPPGYRPGRPRGCGRTRPASQQDIRVIESLRHWAARASVAASSPKGRMWKIEERESRCLTRLVQCQARTQRDCRPAGGRPVHNLL